MSQTSPFNPIADILTPPAKAGMSMLQQRRPRRRLDRVAYAELRRQVLMRDGWWCQRYDPSTNLQVHHVRSRSNLGNDTFDNLITPLTWTVIGQYIRLEGDKSAKETDVGGRN